MRKRKITAALAVVSSWLYFVASAGAQGTSDRFLLFSSTDVWRQGSFLHGGVLWSPGGLDNEGFALKALISAGTYTYLSDTLGQVRGREFVAQLMPGWHFKFNHIEFKAFAGLDLENHRLSPDDPDNRLRGSDLGLRAAFELWSEPTSNTMIAADGSISTIDHNYSFRAAAGWRIADLFYLGPEVQAYASDGYMQRRVGIHLTAFRFRDLEWSAAGGFARDSDDRDSAYVRLSVSRRR
jgi:hypothetical protein